MAEEETSPTYKRVLLREFIESPVWHQVLLPAIKTLRQYWTDQYASCKDLQDFLKTQARIEAIDWLLSSIDITVKNPVSPKGPGLLDTTFLKQPESS